MKNFEKLKELVNSLQPEAEKFYEKGNKSAGTRLRQGMQEMKAIAQTIRGEVIQLKNGGENKDVESKGKKAAGTKTAPVAAKKTS